MDKKSMIDQNSGQEQYYQTIARLLFSLRGAPFILSAREIGVIEEWEEHQVPLNIVLEGIKSAYEYFRRNQSFRKSFTLTFCNRFVSFAYHQYRERRIGQKGTDETREKKIKRIKAQVKSFLSDLSKEMSYLKALYQDILDDLSAENLDENVLEKRDEQVDQLLLERAPEGSIEKYKKEVSTQYRVTQESEKIQIARRKYLQNVRKKHKIPYVSLFYY